MKQYHVELINLLDKDGYPTEYALEKIRNWDVSAPGMVNDLLTFVADLWQYPEYWWTHVGEDPDGFGGDTEWEWWHLNTAGWSGNEDLIAALQANHIFWACFWYQSNRGGKYQFRTPLLPNEVERV